VDLGIEEDFIFENFPEGPGRVLSNIKDDETRVKALNYVAAALKRGEKVTEKDLRGTLKTWQETSGKSCTVGKRGANLGQPRKHFTNVKPATPDNEVKHIESPPVTNADRERKARLNPPEEPAGDPAIGGMRTLKEAEEGTPAPIITEPRQPLEKPKDKHYYAAELLKLMPDSTKKEVDQLLKEHASWKPVDVFYFGIQALAAPKPATTKKA
jgi:hypothetical protein